MSEFNKAKEQLKWSLHDYLKNDKDRVAATSIIFDWIDHHLAVVDVSITRSRADSEKSSIDFSAHDEDTAKRAIVEKLFQSKMYELERTMGPFEYQKTFKILVWKG